MNGETEKGIRFKVFRSPSAYSIYAFAIFVSVLVYPGGPSSPVITFLADFLVTKGVGEQFKEQSDYGPMLISTASVIIYSLLSVIISFGIYTYMNIQRKK